MKNAFAIFNSKSNIVFFLNSLNIYKSIFLNIKIKFSILKEM